MARAHRSNNPAYSSVSRVLFNQSGTTLIEYPVGRMGSYSIPTNVTSIANGAFQFCSSLTSVIIPNSVTNIGADAFGGCSNLTSVTIHSSVTSIADSAFQGCTSLTSVTIPNSVTGIGVYPFAYCTNLGRVYFQAALKVSALLNNGNKIHPAAS